MSRIQEAGIVPIDTGLIIPPKRDEEAFIKRPKFGKEEFPAKRRIYSGLVARRA
jgi:hypothetical protein